MESMHTAPEYPIYPVGIMVDVGRDKAELAISLNEI